MIKTKSIRVPAEASDGRRVLIMGLWPRGYTRERLQLAEPGGWRRDVAPSKALRQDWYAGRVDWAGYTERYIEEMRARREAIAELAHLAKTETVTLLCIEDESNPHCHRHLLKKLIQEAMQEP